MPTFQPKTEAEVKTANTKVFPAGVYDFEIKGATDKKSKASGNDMTELRLRIFDADLNETTVWDYLLYTDEQASKLRGCCEAIGILPKYESGTLEAGDFETGVGQVKIKVQPAKDGYEEKNVVSYYLARRSPEEIAKVEKNHGISVGKKKNLKDDLADNIPGFD